MSDQLELIKDYIKENEGLRLTKYKDSVGKWTIGFGHLILPGENYNVITLQQAHDIFDTDFKKHLDAAKKFPNFNNLTAKQQIVIVDMTFNLGYTFFHEWPKFTKYLSTGQKEKAANELKTSKYYKQVGRRAKNNINLILAN